MKAKYLVWPLCGLMTLAWAKDPQEKQKSTPGSSEKRESAGDSPAEAADGPAEEPAPATEVENINWSELDKMAGRFLAAQRKGEKSENSAMSPLAVATALAALREGAAGETAAELDKLLGQELAATGASLWNQLAALPPGADWKMGHGLWYHQAHPLRSGYVQRLAEMKGLKLEALDFGKPGAIEGISEWAKEQSGGALEQPVSKGAINSLTRLVWISLMNHAAKWEVAFDPKKTEVAKFQSPGGARSVAMMSGLIPIRLFEGPKGEAFAIFPLKGGTSQLEVRLPKEGLDNEAFTAWLEQPLVTVEMAKETKAKVSFPKLEVSSRISWNKVLPLLGGKTLLAAADLSKATEEGGLKLTEFVTETKLSLDESGVKAASSAAAVAGVRGIQKDVPTLVLDRPFMWTIRDITSGVPLAVGVVESPAEVKEEEAEQPTEETTNPDPVEESPAQ